MNTVRERVLVIPGLNGHPGLLMASERRLFPGWDAQAFDHHSDLALEGIGGLARRAIALIAHDCVYVCGESFGGTVALTAAHLAPDRVKGLILFSTFGWHPSMLARRGQRALAFWSFLGARVNTAVYRTGRVASLATQFGTRMQPELLTAYLRHPRANVTAYRRKAELSLTFDARPWLPSIRQPAFILTGRFDPIVPVSAGHELARLLPNATLHTLPGGHLAHLVNASRAGELITHWAGHTE